MTEKNAKLPIISKREAIYLGYCRLGYIWKETHPTTQATDQNSFIAYGEHNKFFIVSLLPDYEYIIKLI